MDRMQTRESKVGGHVVHCTPHRARAGARLLAKVGRAVGPALAKVVTGSAITAVRDGRAPTADDVEIGNIDGAIEALFAQLSDQAVDALILEILASTSIVLPGDDGSDRLHDLSKSAEIDAAFTGQLPLMFAVMRYALEVNFGPFFAANGALAAFAQAAAASAALSSASPASSAQSGTASS